MQGDSTGSAAGASPQFAATRELMLAVYQDLHRLAQRFLARERPDHTLQTTALLHEAYLRMAEHTRAQWVDRNHFFAVAAEAMRRILVDHARRVQAAKRGGDRGRVSLGELVEIADAETSQLDPIALSEAVDRLRALHERRGRVVELKFFAGMQNAEIAEVLSVSRATVADDWTVARAWLRAELTAIVADAEPSPAASGPGSP